jgi:hypothetical protein
MIHFSNISFFCFQPLGINKTYDGYIKKVEEESRQTIPDLKEDLT